MKAFLNVMRASARTMIYIGIIIVLWAGQGQAQDQQFFETLYDVPLMTDMEEVPSMAMSFDKPTGRIAEAGAIAPKASKAEIESFYKVSLSEMGWKFEEKQENTLIFSRESEKLSISVDQSQKASLVRFQLKPLYRAK